MRGSRRLLGVAFVLLVTSFATSCSASNKCEYPDDQLNPDGIRAAISLDVGGLGDKSFNDAAKRGLDAAVADGLVSEAKCIESNSTGSNRGENTQALAEAGFDLVIPNGYLFSTDVKELYADYPDTNFLVTDGFATALWDDPATTEFEPMPESVTNVADMTFAEHEGSYVIGAAAVLACECDTIGFLGGVPNQLIGKFETGYRAGAESIDPNVTVLVEYINEDPNIGFNDAVAAEALATKMYNAGAEVVYHAAGASGAGLFNASVKADEMAIGVDSDQYLTASAEQQPLILTSMLKRVDTGVYTAIESVKNGAFEAGTQVYTTADDGVDFSTSNTELMTEDLIAQLTEIRDQIIAGDIKVASCEPDMAWCDEAAA
jgi:basic membrane protein A